MALGRSPWPLGKKAGLTRASGFRRKLRQCPLTAIQKPLEPQTDFLMGLLSAFTCRCRMKKL